MLMMSLMQPTVYKSQQNHKSSPRCLPHSINTSSIWLTVVYQSAEDAGISSSTETGLNGEHAVKHQLLRFYTLKMSVDIVMLPELLLSSPQTVIFYLFIRYQGLFFVFLTLLLFASSFYFYENPISWRTHLHFL